MVSKKYLIGLSIYEACRIKIPRGFLEPNGMYINNDRVYFNFNDSVN